MTAPTVPIVNAPRRNRGLLRRLIALAAFLVLLYVIISLSAAWVLTAGSHKPIDANPLTIGQKYENVSFTSRTDNITLKGWLFIPSAPASGRSVVMAHGWQQNRVNGNYTLGVAHDLIAHGYSVLLFDERGCGESGGDRFTLGDRERYDVLAAYDFMKSRGYQPNMMTMMGLSMGAAATIEAAPQMPDVAAIVPDSSYAELRPILEKELPPRSHLPAFFNWGIITAATLFGDNPDLRPVDVVSSLPSRAFLFFHGGADTLIPVEHGKELRAASTNWQSDLVIVPSANHGGEYEANPAPYMERLYQFINAQVSQKGGA